MDFIKENKNLIYSAILFLCIFLIYIVVVKGVFFFDDDTFVRLNSSISEGKPFYEYFTSHVLDGANLPSNFYRPLQVILGRLIFIFWGLNSFYFHFIQIAIHSFNGVLVFYLLNKLGFKKEHSFIAALLFGIHPVLTESVSYISGLADPLYLMFTLLAALSFLRVLHSKSNKVIYSIITLLMILLALFSRETAVISFLFLVLIFLYDRNSRKDEGFFNNKYALTTLFISFVLSVIYLLLRFTILKFTENIGLNKDTNEYTESLLIRIVTFVSILWDYFVLIIFPKNLNYEKPYTAYAVIDTTRFIFGFLWILLSIVFSYFSFRKKGVFWLGVLTFWIFLIPVTGIIPLNSMYLEHWLYGSFIGLAIILAWLLDLIEENANSTLNYIFLFMLSILFIFLSLRTVARNKEWANPIAFWQNELKYEDKSARVYNNLAMAYIDEGKLDLAIETYNKATEVSDTYPQVYYNLGNAYLEKNKIEDAFNSYMTSLEIEPNFIYSHQALYNFFKVSGHESEAAIFAKFINKIQIGENLTWDEIKQTIEASQQTE